METEPAMIPRARRRPWCPGCWLCRPCAFLGGLALGLALEWLGEAAALWWWQA